MLAWQSLVYIPHFANLSCKISFKCEVWNPNIAFPSWGAHTRALLNPRKIVGNFRSPPPITNSTPTQVQDWTISINILYIHEFDVMYHQWLLKLSYCNKKIHSSISVSKNLEFSCWLGPPCVYSALRIHDLLQPAWWAFQVLNSVKRFKFNSDILVKHVGLMWYNTSS